MREIESMGKFASLLSIIEIGLGSFLHGFQVPFAGHFLSLNQGLILTRAHSTIQDKSSGAIISTTSALLKSLSPAGKKLTPMLAISVQGHLFSLGSYIFGNNVVGHLLGMALLSLWGFVQPFCLYYLLYGKDLIFMANYYIKKFGSILPANHQNILSVILILVILKVFFGAVVVLIAHNLKSQTVNDYEDWARKRVKLRNKSNNSNIFLGAFRDLLNIPFILSFILMFLFFVFAGAGQYWSLLRPIAIGFLIFLFIRVFPLEKMASKLRDGKYKEVLQLALKNLSLNESQESEK